MKYRLMLAMLIAVVSGCDSLSSTIDQSPEHWADLNGRTVTIRGTAGNSEQGPIVRMRDGGYIPLKARAPWAIDVLGRTVDVHGKVVSGAGFRLEKYILDAHDIKLVTPAKAPQ